MPSANVAEHGRKPAWFGYWFGYGRALLVSPAIDIIPRRGGRIRTMHILVVDDAKLGAITGEIAVPGIVCDKPDCGCDRGHVGLDSSTMTELVTVHNLS